MPLSVCRGIARVHAFYATARAPSLGPVLRFRLVRRAAVPLVVVLLGCNPVPGVVPVDRPEDAGADAPAVPSPRAEPGRHDVRVIDTRRVVPGPGLPPEAAALTSNNNVDVVRHADGRVYLAWRTAPDHYASDKVSIHVVSSTDEQTWRFEATLTAGSDLREPRFLPLGAELFLYVAKLGTDPLKFEPRGMAYTRRAADGTWSALADVYKPGIIPWRAKIERGTPYLVAYLGGEHIYKFDRVPLELELLTTASGVDFVGVDPQKPVVLRGGGSEADFTLGDDGALFAVQRNEAGDATGFGSKVCRAPPGRLAEWTCKHDPKKYDSPLMFWHDGEAYLVARRNVTETGSYDLGRSDVPDDGKALAYQLDYRGKPKRCAIWRYVQGEDRVAFLADLPSRGDTCFPAIIRAPEPGKFVIYNYSSDVDGPDLPWVDGQARPTFIYRHVVELVRR
jgi:hypothetical protein